MRLYLVIDSSNLILLEKSYHGPIKSREITKVNTSCRTEF